MTTPTSEAVELGDDEVPGGDTGSGEETGTIWVAFRHDPFAARSWSGTARHLVDALSGLGWTVEGAALELGGTATNIVRRAHRALRLGPDVVRNPIARRVRGAKLARALRSSSADTVLHLGTMHLPAPIGRDGRRHVLFTDTTWAAWSPHRDQTRRMSPLMRRRAFADERRAYRQMDHIFTVSDAARRSVVDDFGIPAERVTAVGTGLGQVLPPADLTNGGGTTGGVATDGVVARTGVAPGGPPQLLYVGKHREHDKGLDIVLDAFALLRDMGSGAALTIVGKLPPDVSEPPPGVEVVSWVETDELAALYARSDLFVMPARNEPWGLVYLEALSQGTPILGVDRHAFRELCGDGAYGVIADRPEAVAVARAVADALADRPGLARKGAAGRRFVAEFADWNRVARRITDGIVRP